MTYRSLGWTLALLLPLAAACNKSDTATTGEGAETPSDSAMQTPPAASTTEAPGINNSSTDVNPVSAQVAIDDVQIGHSLDAAGKIADGQSGDDFAPGDPVYLAMEVGDAPAGSAVKAHWVGPNETPIGDQNATVTAGQKYLSFSQTDTSKWAKGDYKVEVWFGDEKVNTQQFNVTDTASADKH